KQKKGTVSLIILAVMLLLAACSGGKGNSGGSSSNGEPAEAPKASDLKPYVVSLMYPGTTQPDEALVEEAMNKILKEKINATIDLQAIDWGAWNDKMNLMFASGEKADLVFTASWNGHVDNVTKGAFVEL